MWRVRSMARVTAGALYRRVSQNGPTLMNAYWTTVRHPVPRCVTGVLYVARSCRTCILPVQILHATSRSCTQRVTQQPACVTETQHMCGHRPPETPGPLEEADEDDLDVIGSSRHVGGSDDDHDARGGDHDERGWTRRVATMFPGDQRERVEQRLHGMAAKVQASRPMIPSYGRSFPWLCHV